MNEAAPIYPAMFTQLLQILAEIVNLIMYDDCN